MKIRIDRLKAILRDIDYTIYHIVDHATGEARETTQEQVERAGLETLASQISETY